MNAQTTMPDTPSSFEPGQGQAPFDTDRLDRLMEEAGLEALLVTSKHSIQYLLGGYRYFFYDYMDAHGLSRYLPFFVYIKGKPFASTYVASPMEVYEQELGKFWVSQFDFKNMTSAEYAAAAVRSLQNAICVSGRIGVEIGFLPTDAYRVLVSGLPDADIVDATFTLELLRALKGPRELDILRVASEKVIDSLLAVMAGHGVGTTKQALFDAVRREEESRGLKFEYCLTNMGQSFNRAPSSQVWQRGDVLALDSGGNYKGYIGDLCRMAYLGEPDQELVDLLGEIEDIQQAARKPIRAGARGGDIYVAPEAMVAGSANRAELSFVAHGMGIVSHEAPWLTDRCSVPYPAYHVDRPLEVGMVISIETTLLHPQRGFIKLEDTLAVTADGWEAFGDHGRGWNCGLD